MSEKTKDTLITLLIIFTFLFPVIPLGLIYAYQHIFTQQNDGESKANNFQASEDFSREDPVTGIESYDTRESSVYECTSDCSGHEAGYEWAESNDVCDPYFDGGNSESFAEGVRAYGEVNCPDDSYDDTDEYDYR